MFQKARLKLTAWYLLIIMLISISFSLVIYKVQVQEMQRFASAQRMRMERDLERNDIFRPQPPIIDDDLIIETENRLLINILIINTFILIASGVSSYLLAGKTLRPIKDMVDEQDRFISDSSHELRTPLTSLKSAMEVALRDKSLTLVDAKILIKDNINDVNRLQKLSDSLIQLTRKNSKQGLKIENISTKEILESAIKQIKSQADIKKIVIKSKIKNLKFSGDQEKLTNLFVILLDNAVKYSSEKKAVTVKAWKTKHFINVSVKDRGIGIAEKDLSHIFDRFFRADTSRSNVKATGYGLGLSIAKMIVDQHHGSINVKSTFDNGSVFTVKLPC